LANRRGKLYLVGMGLSPRYLTVEAQEVISRADVVLVEGYTSRLDISELATILKREDLRLVTRRDLEELSGRTILDMLDKGMDVVLITPGDPLVATTHVTLLIEAHRAGFEFHVVPGVSIIPTAVAFCGLMIYKLGRVATVVYPKDGITFEYPYDIIKANDDRNLHTLLLLEYDGEKGIAMRAVDALKILKEIEERRRENVVVEDRLVAVAASLGYPDFSVCIDKLEEVAKMDVKSVPQTLIFVSPRPHPVELEMIEVVNSRWCRS